MKIYYFFLLTFIASIYSSLIGQEAKVQTTFLRPSIVTLYGSISEDDITKNAIVNLKHNSVIQTRFDNHEVEFKDIIFNLPDLPDKPIFPKAPIKPDTSASTKVLNKYKIDLKEYNIERSQLKIQQKKYDNAVKERSKLKQQQIQAYANKASKEIVGQWYSRDSLGNMNVELWKKRANYNASDYDVNIANKSAVNRISYLGEELMQKTYLVINTVDDIYSMKEFYDKKDANKKIEEKYLNKEFVPTFREREGYHIVGSSQIYKLIFNDSISAVFYQKYWLDTNVKSGREVQLSNWENATFPMEYIATKSVSSNKNTQYTEEYYNKLIDENPEKKATYLKANKKRVPTEQLKSSVGNLNFTKIALESFIKKIDDFKLKATVSNAYPITAKIGTKEGIKKDKRWGIYEIYLDKNGNQKKKKTGYARVTKIARNDTIATGSSPASTFRQNGGKKAYSGMLMEPKPGGIVSLYAGYGIATNDDRSTSGFSLDLDLRIVNGFKIGGGIIFNSFNNFIPGESTLSNPLELYNTTELTDSNNVVIDTLYTSISFNQLFEDTTETSGTTFMYHFNISKELLLGNRGNLYLLPKVGMGLTTYNFSNTNSDIIGTLIKDTSDAQSSISLEEINNLYKWTALSAFISLEFGANLIPELALFIRPAIIYKNRFSTTSADDSTIPSQEIDFTKTDQKNWRFEGATFPIFFGVRITL